MKKITFLTVLIAFLTLWSVNTFAKEYDLWFCTTQVTDANKDNIKGKLHSSDPQTGTVSYNPETKTLTLNNVTVPETGHSIIENEINGLTINLIGENICNSSAGYQLNFFENTTIKGSGSLCIVGRGYNIYSGIRLNDGAVLTIENTKITLGWPISSHIEDRSGKLVVKNSSVICSQIKYLKSITITDCAITHGKLKYDDDFDYYDVTNSTSRVQIHPTYPLWVGGSQVHAGNLDTILGENDGSVRYNPTTKTMELSGGTISTKGSKCAIESEIAGLTIDVSSPQHKVFLQSEEGIAMWLKGKTTITGGGQLYATSRSSSAIYHKSDLRRIGNCHWCQSWHLWRW